MKCRDCGYNDKEDLHDKCPKCKGDDWVECNEVSPRKIAKNIVREWFEFSDLEQISLKDQNKLIKMIAAAVRDER